MAWWAWLWTIVLLAVSVDASRDDLAEGVALWKVVADALTALLTIACIVAYFHPNLTARLPCLVVQVATIAAGVCLSLRSIEGYREVRAAGEMSSTGDRALAIVVTLAVAALHVPAWRLGWVASC